MGIRVLGWSIIALVGGGATVVSLALVVLMALLADVFLLAKTPTEREYLTIVRLKGTTDVGGPDGGYIYELRNAQGFSQDATLPWRAQPGDRIRVGSGRTRIFRLTLPTEAPVLCSVASPCD